jgi:glycosyltransferase involved in cell wall biosynthesis
MTGRRVLWLIKGLGLGGAERLLVSLAGRLDLERFDLAVAYLLPASEEFAPAFERLGVPTTCLDARWTAELGWPSRLRKLLRARDFELIHTHSPLPGAAARLLATSEVTFVHTEHNLWSSYRRPTYAVNAATFGRNAIGFAVSDAVRESMVRPWWLGGPHLPPIETLLHGVDVAQVQRGVAARADARDVLDLAPDTPVIGTVASFTPQKDHAGLLEAMVDVRRQVPDVVLLLIGAGPLEPEIRATVDRLDLAANVRFLGPRTDVARLLPGLDVFVLASRFEGLAISLLEAMASGVACVATSVGGTPEVVTHGVDGILVPPGQPPSLATALVGVLADEEMRAAIGSAGAQRVADEFTIDRAARRTEVLYEQVLARQLR